ncbi:hypothetical protein ABIB80_004493 [Bradyrhizobium sp. i1.15.2]
MLNRNLIGGEWIAGYDSSVNSSPSDASDIIGEYAAADREDVERAIDAATAAFPAWSRATTEFRSDILDRVGSEILARRAEIGHILAREEGKTLSEAIGETVCAARIFKYFAGEAIRLEGERLDSVRPSIQVEVIREPEGVIGIIEPWNFPIAIPAWKIAPALAYGNTVVYKPAELVPACAWILADILQRAGTPAGVFNLVMGLRCGGWRRNRQIGPYPGRELYRLRADRPTHQRRLRGARQEGATRARRQEPCDRCRRCRSRCCCQRSHQWLVFFNRPALHGIKPPYCRRRHPQ